MTDKCPSCEYNKQRAALWREEAYRQAGTPLPEPRREWVSLTDEEITQAFEHMGRGFDKYAVFARAIEAKLREKNT